MTSLQQKQNQLNEMVKSLEYKIENDLITTHKEFMKESEPINILLKEIEELK